MEGSGWFQRSFYVSPTKKQKSVNMADGVDGCLKRINQREDSQEPQLSFKKTSSVSTQYSSAM